MPFLCLKSFDDASLPTKLNKLYLVCCSGKNVVNMSVRPQAALLKLSEPQVFLSLNLDIKLSQIKKSLNLKLNHASV